MIPVPDEEWDSNFNVPTHRNVVYMCQGPGCVTTCGTYQDARDHTKETRHSKFLLREVKNGD